MPSRRNIKPQSTEPKAPKRSPDERERDLAITAELHLKGWRQIDIADRLGLSQSTISNDIAEIRQRWRERQAVAIDEALSREIANIALMERELWEAWEASKRTRRRVVQESERQRNKDGQPEGNAQMVQVGQKVTVEERTGDPRYIEKLQWCSEQRAKLYGLMVERHEIAMSIHEGLTMEQRTDQLNQLLLQAAKRKSEATKH